MDLGFRVMGLGFRLWGLRLRSSGFRSRGSSGPYTHLRRPVCRVARASAQHAHVGEGAVLGLGMVCWGVNEDGLYEAGDGKRQRGVCVADYFPT